MSGRISRFFIFSILLPICIPFLVAGQSVVNINTAGLAELDTLPGVGPAIAQKIIDYRVANGSFQTIEEIMNVSGIGQTTFENMKHLISVGDSGGENTNQTVSASTTQSSSTTTVPSGSRPTYILSSGVPALNIGPDRVGVVGAPMVFQAEIGGKPIVAGRNIFRWNLGDGTQAGGPSATHEYEYPGEYVVVLSADFPEGESVARVRVKIVEAGVSITHASIDRVEISNDTSHEIDLYGRGIVSTQGVFVFPENTFIGAGQKISFSSKVTGIRPNTLGEVELRVFGERVGQATKVMHEEEVQKMVKIAAIKKEVGELQGKVAAMRSSAPKYFAPDVSPASVPEVVEKDDGVQTQTALVLESIDEVVSEGWWGRLKKFFLRKE